MLGSPGWGLRLWSRLCGFSGGRVSWWGASGGSRSPTATRIVFGVIAPAVVFAAAGTTFLSVDRTEVEALVRTVRAFLALPHLPVLAELLGIAATAFAGQGDLGGGAVGDIDLGRSA